MCPHVYVLFWQGTPVSSPACTLTTCTQCRLPGTGEIHGVSLAKGLLGQETRLDALNALNALNELNELNALSKLRFC